MWQLSGCHISFDVTFVFFYMHYIEFSKENMGKIDIVDKKI